MATTTSPEKKPPITCHILDTTRGRPASSIPTTLTLHNPPPTISSVPLTFTSTTNSDGRVTSWTPTAAAFSSSSSPSSSLDAVFAAAAADQQYSLTFDTRAYWKENGVEESFYDDVVVRFVVRRAMAERKEHFHVPVLLGPFGYTTYRGS
ncbi:putative transthyretin-like protein [Aaosphaeria arxii CBS 175.79]|uniref:5-hydroxyisourate hydrolase n=1 Tax=Aaosphaeria arxii CBS 175.79 TaxID=1450172 RepID=A0A6A5XD48_9PLEO|nr:putative transthyretin-like protein [Aaosphaeria arxii CBS 175.79]KAF2011045.1 putative transthyretin-like protein [Aaosphaeria arxii CBS 175.79]